MMLHLLPYCLSTRALEQGNPYSILTDYFSAPADDSGEDIYYTFILAKYFTESSGTNFSNLMIINGTLQVNIALLDD